MQFSRDLVCPLCHGDIKECPEVLTCEVCGADFPVIFGIPDMRPRAARSVYYDDPTELAELAEAATRLSYEELETLAFGKAEGFQALYRQAAEQRGEDHWAEAERMAGGSPAGAHNLALDIGCGPGGNLVSLARRFGRSYGVDVNFKLLILARRRLEERGLGDRTMVVAASGDALPFPSDTFDYVTAMNVIEHVEDQRGMLAEIHRVLFEEGALFFDSPNRFTLLPEPHVKLWGVGFLPRTWADPYVRWRKGIGYEGKRLLSLVELRKMMRRQFRSFRIHLPSYEERSYYPEGRGKKAVRYAYNGVFRRLPVTRELLFPFVPTYNVLARKK